MQFLIYSCALFASIATLILSIYSLRAPDWYVFSILFTPSSLFLNRFRASNVCLPVWCGCLGFVSKHQAPRLFSTAPPTVSARSAIGPIFILNFSAGHFLTVSAIAHQAKTWFNSNQHGGSTSTTPSTALSSHTPCTPNLFLWEAVWSKSQMTMMSHPPRL